MKRATLQVCTSCEADDDRGDGAAFFERLKVLRKAQGLKPFFRLRDVDCLDGCDTPCNARLKAKDREAVRLTWLDGVDDAQPLLDAAKQYATGAAPRFPGRVA